MLATGKVNTFYKKIACVICKNRGNVVDIGRIGFGKKSIRAQAFSRRKTGLKKILKKFLFFLVKTFDNNKST